MVMLFLVESARPAVTNLRGFIAAQKNLILTVNIDSHHPGYGTFLRLSLSRSFFFQFFSNVATYIIVLVQFSQKGSSFSVSL